MKAKNLVFLSVLVAIGFVLHAAIPGIFFGMKPDMMLMMMFLGVFLFPELKSVVLLGISTGIISALTTTFPLGQIPNIIDKIVTVFLVYLLLLLLKKIMKDFIAVILLTPICTIISGYVFLSTALILSGLPAPFIALFLSVVLPAALVNTVAMVIIYPIVVKIKERMKF